MGAQIAAHLANAGVPVLLLDVTPEAARDGLKRALALKPDPFFTRDTASLITTGGFDRDLARIARLGLDRRSDRRAARRQASAVRARRVGAPRRIDRVLEHVRHPDRGAGRRTQRRLPAPLARHALLQSAALSAAARDHPDAGHRSRRGRAHLLVCRSSSRQRRGRRAGTRRTSSPTTSACSASSRRCARSKAVDYTIEEIDAITGPALGRPQSATFRTMDIAGIDVLGHVAQNLTERLPDAADREAFALPPLVAGSDRTRLGRREGRPGVLQADRAATSSPSIRRRSRIVPGSRRVSRRVDNAQGIDDVGERIRTLFLGRDKVGAFLRDTLGSLLVYTAQVTPDIAYSIDDVDRAMRWGFGWELGPFEIVGCDRHQERAGRPRDLRARGARARGRADRSGPRHVPRGAGAAGGAGPANPAVGKRARARGQAQRRREPRRSWRRRAGGRISLEDERDRRRHGRRC